MEKIEEKSENTDNFKKKTKKQVYSYPFIRKKRVDKSTNTFSYSYPFVLRYGKGSSSRLLSRKKK